MTFLNLIWPSFLIVFSQIACMNEAVSQMSHSSIVRSKDSIDTNHCRFKNYLPKNFHFLQQGPILVVSWIFKLILVATKLHKWIS